LAQDWLFRKIAAYGLWYGCDVFGKRRLSRAASSKSEMLSLSMRTSAALLLLAGLLSVDARLTLKTPKYSVLSESGSVLKSDAYVA